MPNYLSDSTKSHWMVSNPKRLIRTGMDGKPFRCPFCPGNESLTPPEVYRAGGGEKDKEGWSIRVVPNLYPITDIHEVIVHSPDHDKNIEDFSQEQVEAIINVYINRFKYWSEIASSSPDGRRDPPRDDKRPRGKVFIFHNYSLTSGASLIHPHSQISVVPNEIPTDTLSVQPVVNIVEQVGEFVSYCPGYSEWSYEVWITEIPKQVRNDTSKDRHPELVSGSHFENLSKEQIKDLAKILQSSIRKLKKIHQGNAHYSKKEFGYNFYIYIPQAKKDSGVARSSASWRIRSLPRMTKSEAVIPASPSISLRVNDRVGDKGARPESSQDSWYLRIIPRFMERAGFELSTGIMVNSVEAKESAKELITQ